MPTLVENQQHAENRKACGGDQQHCSMNNRQNSGEIQRAKRQFAGKRGVDCIQAGNHDDRQRHHAFDQHDDAVNTCNQRQPAVSRIAVILRRLRLRNDAGLFDCCDFGFVGDGFAHIFNLAHACSSFPAQRYQNPIAVRYTR